MRGMARSGRAVPVLVTVEGGAPEHAAADVLLPASDVREVIQHVGDEHDYLALPVALAPLADRESLSTASPDPVTMWCTNRTCGQGASCSYPHRCVGRSSRCRREGGGSFDSSDDGSSDRGRCRTRERNGCTGPDRAPPTGLRARRPRRLRRRWFLVLLRTWSRCRLLQWGRRSVSISLGTGR